MHLLLHQIRHLPLHLYYTYYYLLRYLLIHLLHLLWYLHLHQRLHLLQYLLLGGLGSISLDCDSSRLVGGHKTASGCWPSLSVQRHSECLLTKPECSKTFWVVADRAWVFKDILSGCWPSLSVQRHSKWLLTKPECSKTFWVVADQAWVFKYLSVQRHSNAYTTNSLNKYVYTWHPIVSRSECQILIFVSNQSQFSCIGCQPPHRVVSHFSHFLIQGN